MHRRRLRRLRHLVLLPAVLSAALGVPAAALAMPADGGKPAASQPAARYVLDTSEPRGDARGPAAWGLDLSAPRGDAPAMRAVPAAPASAPATVRTVIREDDPALPIVLSAIALAVALGGTSLALARVARVRHTVA